MKKILAVEHPSFQKNTLAVEQAAMFRGPRLHLNGQVLTGKRRIYTIADDNGEEQTIQLKPSMLEAIPKVKIGNELITLVEPLKWYQYVWMALPILLVFVGGALGALCGLGAYGVNSTIFRSSKNPFMKYVLTGLVSTVAVVCFYILGSAITAGLS